MIRGVQTSRNSCEIINRWCQRLQIDNNKRDVTSEEYWTVYSNYEPTNIKWTVQGNKSNANLHVLAIVKMKENTMQSFMVFSKIRL